jgi:Ca2+-binding EF-hand superfamily protein
MQAGNTFFNSSVPTIVLQSLFQKYDTDDSGFLEEKEMKCLLENDLGLDASQSEIYTLLLDQDGDHSVSFEDFMNWLRSEERFQNIDNSSRYAILCQAVDYFKSFDVDNNDILSMEEFKYLMCSLGCVDEENTSKAFQAIDTHGNGIISFWEFMKWLNWLPL